MKNEGNIFSFEDVYNTKNGKRNEEQLFLKNQLVNIEHILKSHVSQKTQKQIELFSNQIEIFTRENSILNGLLHSKVEFLHFILSRIRSCSSSHLSSLHHISTPIVNVCGNMGSGKTKFSIHSGLLYYSIFCDETHFFSLQTKFKENMKKYNEIMTGGETSPHHPLDRNNDLLLDLIQLKCLFPKKDSGETRTLDEVLKLNSEEKIDQIGDEKYKNFCISVELFAQKMTNYTEFLLSKIPEGGGNNTAEKEEEEDTNDGAFGQFLQKEVLSPITIKDIRNYLQNYTRKDILEETFGEKKIIIFDLSNENPDGTSGLMSEFYFFLELLKENGVKPMLILINSPLQNKIRANEFRIVLRPLATDEMTKLFCMLLFKELKFSSSKTFHLDENLVKYNDQKEKYLISKDLFAFFENYREPFGNMWAFSSFWFKFKSSLLAEYFIENFSPEEQQHHHHTDNKKEIYIENLYSVANEMNIL